MSLVWKTVQSVRICQSGSDRASPLSPAPSIVEVISDVLPGLTVDPDSDIVFTYKNPASSETDLEFGISEGFATAFTDDIGTLGQTVATRVQIRVGGLPEGSTLTFPDSVGSSDTPATLEVIPDSELILSVEEEELTITYAFDSSASSEDLTESFIIPYTLTVDTPPQEQAVVFLQASLFPSENLNDPDDVPRFVEEFLPPEDELPLPEFETFFPTNLAQDEVLGLAFTNPREFEVEVELTALDPGGDPVAGEGITNPAIFTIPPGGQTSLLLEEAFGPGILPVDIGTIVSLSRRGEVATLLFVTDGENQLLEGGAAGQTPLQSFVLPNVSRSGNSPFTRTHLFNPSTDSEVEVELTLYDMAGQTVASTEMTLPPRGTLNEDLTTLFEVGLATLSGGYVLGSASGDGLVGFESFGDERTINLLSAGITSLRRQSYWVPRFVAAAGFDTRLSLINTDDLKAVTMMVSAFNEQGNPLFTPAGIVLQPGEQGTFSVAALFGFSGDDLIAGWLRLDLEDIFLGPFLDIPSLNGSVQFLTTDGRVSASIPLFLLADADALYPHIAQDQGFFTGVAVLNTQDESVEVTVEAFGEDGSKIGESTFSLASGAKTAQLLPELIPDTQGVPGGHFRVTADDSILSIGLFGDLAGESLATIPSQ